MRFRKSCEQGGSPCLGKNMESEAYPSQFHPRYVAGTPGNSGGTALGRIGNGELVKEGGGLLRVSTEGGGRTGGGRGGQAVCEETVSVGGQLAAGNEGLVQGSVRQGQAIDLLATG